MSESPKIIIEATKELEKLNRETKVPFDIDKSRSLWWWAFHKKITQYLSFKSIPPYKGTPMTGRVDIDFNAPAK